MKKLLLALLLLNPLFVHAESDTEKENRLVREIKEISSSIIDVRPARTIEPAIKSFPVEWSPAITLKKGTSVDEQKEIAKKVGQYVVQFQKGVRTEATEGGILVFVEGNDWYPAVGQVSYKIASRSPVKVDVYLNFRMVENNQVVGTCCDENQDEKIARLAPKGK